MKFPISEFLKLASYIGDFAEHIKMASTCRLFFNVLPLWVSHSRLYEWMVGRYLNETYQTVQNIMEEILKHIKNHRSKLDMANPNDFMDILLIAAENDPELGYGTLAYTFLSLYVAASETLSNTMRWLCLTLADHPEVQEQMLKEIKTSIEKDGEILKENCPYVRSVLLENMRWHPVIDSLPHQATEDTVINGVTIPNRTPIFASLTSVMHDPKNFPNPGEFIPDRFVVDGVFKSDVRVCGFSLGLRNCIGKQLATEQYFTFSANIVRDFKLVRTAGNMDCDTNIGILMPNKKSRVRFDKRR